MSWSLDYATESNDAISYENVGNNGYDFKCGYSKVRKENKEDDVKKTKKTMFVWKRVN
jgi:hypothetical protein